MPRQSSRFLGCAVAAPPAAQARQPQTPPLRCGVKFPQFGGHAGRNHSRKNINMSKPHPPYDKDFRMEAVNLLLSSGRPLKRLAVELGISDNTLRRWRDQATGKRHGVEVASAKPKELDGVSLSDMAEQMRHLQRENEQLRRQREILKKAMSILAENPPTNMQ